jgi:hypothetical protein
LEEEEEEEEEEGGLYLTIIVDCCVTGNDVWPVACLCEDTMNPLIGSNLLAQHGYRAVRQANSIESVDADPRLHCRMGGLARERDAPFDIGNHVDCGHTRDPLGQQILGSRVNHQTGRRALVSTILDEVQLTAAALLGRRSQQTHPPRAARLLERGRDTEKAGQAGTGNEIVAARVADSRESIVLGVEDDQAAPGAELGGECRLDAVGVGGDVEAEGLEEGYKVVVSLVLFVRELRLRMDLSSKVNAHAMF